MKKTEHVRLTPRAMCEAASTRRETLASCVAPAILGWHMYVDMYVKSRRERGTGRTGMRGPKEQTRGAILGLGI